MVGGRVIETLVVKDRVWINVQDWDENNQRPRNDTCAVYVVNNDEARSISNGDIVWWQGGNVYWTAKDKNGKTVGKADVAIKRLGFSGVRRPEGVPA